MSSSMNDNNNGTKGVVAATTVGNHNATGALNNGSIGPLINGLQNQNDLGVFLQLVEKSEPSTEYLDCLLNTTNQEVLTSKKLIQTVGKHLREFTDRIIDPWQPEHVFKVIKVLDHIPYDFDTMYTNELGFSLKKIRRSAKANDDNNVYNEANELINKWKKINSDSNESTTSGVKRPASPTNTEQNAKRPFKLALQKEAPAPRAKAMSDTGFFRNDRFSTQPKKIYTRPTYYMEDVGSSAPATGEPQPNEDSNKLKAPVRQKKRVHFADNLFEIREYEKNPEEWGNFDTGYHQFGNVGEMEHGEARMAFYHVPQGPFYYPFALALNTGEDGVFIRQQIETDETDKQEAREKSLLSAIYTSIHHIPPSPAEPDEEPDANLHTMVIPLDDISSSQEEIPPQQPVMIPTQSYTQPMPVLNQPINSPPVQQQQQPTVAPPPRREITSEAIDEMIRNNPGLMQSLKQLSSLAGLGLVNNQQQQTSYQQPSYQQQPAGNNSPQYNYQRRPSPPQQYQRNDYDPTREFDRRSKQNKIQKKRRGGNIPKCIFFRKPEGCRNGDDCTYLH